MGWICLALAGLVMQVSAAPLNPPKPPPFYQSPEVGADRQLTLRYYAPQAKTVIAMGELDGQQHPMVKDSAGVWAVTLGPLPPDIYTYSFQVDGVKALDARNPNTKYGNLMFGAVSVVEIPGEGPQFYDAKPVPHGEVRIVPYFSRALGLERTVWVYTPPGYDKGKNFPVFYLLHGAGDVESGWTMIGRAPMILDNLIAEGKAKPMVVVMPLVHAMQSWWTGPAKALTEPITDAFQRGDFAAIGSAMYSGDGKGGLSLFARDFFEEIMPLVEARFKVKKSPEERAIGGLSMGGGQSLHVALTKPELFRYVVLMSPAADGRVDEVYPGFFKDTVAANKAFKLLWVGTGDQDVITGAGTRAFDSLLTAKGIQHRYEVSAGRHEWTVWRHHLRDTAPLLFR